MTASFSPPLSKTRYCQLRYNDAVLEYKNVITLHKVLVPSELLVEFKASLSGLASLAVSSL